MSDHNRAPEALLTAALLSVGGALLWALSTLPLDLPPDPDVSAATLRLGLGNPVTAVLLDLRAYDTLLELAVLLIALVALIAAQPRPHARAERASSPVLCGFTRILLPLLVVVAGYLLWAGADRPGGAFQAGALLGGGGVLWRISGLDMPTLGPGAVRWWTSLGLVTFLALGTAMLPWNGGWLGWPAEGGKVLVLAVETAATASIGALLTALFAAGVGE